MVTSGGMKAKTFAAFALLYFGTPVLLAAMPGFLRRNFGVEPGMWVIPALLLISAAVLAAERLRAPWPRGELVRVSGAGAREWLRVAVRFAVSADVLAAALAVWRPEMLFAFPRTAPRFWLAVMVAYPLLSVVPQGVLYRWFFERRFAAAFGGRTASLVAGAAAFAFAHVVFRNPWAVAFTFAGGLFFLSTYRRTGSLVVSDVEHALYGDWLFTVGWGAFFFEGAAAV